MKKKILCFGLIVVCCATAISVKALDKKSSYLIGAGENKQIMRIVTGASTIYLNTRPTNGGDLTIILKGAKSASAIFPRYTSRSEWEVGGVDKTSDLIINGKAPNGATGTLHVFDK